MRKILNDFFDGAAVAFACALIIAAMFVPPIAFIEHVISSYSTATAFWLGLAVLVIWLFGWSWAFAKMVERKGWDIGYGQPPQPPPPPPARGNNP